MAELLYRIGGFASRRSGIVIVAWVAILALAGVAFAIGGGHLANGLSIPGTPTAQVTERLAPEFPAAAGGNGTIVFRTEDGKPFTDTREGRDHRPDRRGLGHRRRHAGRRPVRDAGGARQPGPADLRGAGAARPGVGPARPGSGPARRRSRAGQGGRNARPGRSRPGRQAGRTRPGQGAARCTAQQARGRSGPAPDVVRHPTRVRGRQCRGGTRHVHRDPVRRGSGHQDRRPGCVQHATDPGRRGRLFDGDRLGHPVHPRRRRIGRPRHRGDRPDRHARHPRRRRSPDPERARRRRHRRPRRAVAVGRRRDGVGDARARRHARPRGRHRLLTVHRQSTPPATEGGLQPARVDQSRDGHLRQRRRLRRDDGLHRAARAQRDRDPLPGRDGHRRRTSAWPSPCSSR